MVRIANQTILADYQDYQQALALVRQADATLFPTIGAAGSVTRSRSSIGVTSAVPNIPGRSYTVNQGAVEGTLSPVRCICDASAACRREGVCSTRGFWTRMMDEINETVDGVSLKDLVEETRNRVMEYYI